MHLRFSLSSPLLLYVFLTLLSVCSNILKLLPTDICKQCTTPPGSLQPANSFSSKISLWWHSRPDDVLRLENVPHLRLVECSTGTVRHPELQVQAHETYLLGAPCPIFLAESYTSATAHLRSVVQTFKMSVSYLRCTFFLSNLHIVKLLFRSAKLLCCYCSPFYQLILCAYVLRLDRALLTPAVVSRLVLCKTNVFVMILRCTFLICSLFGLLYCHTFVFALGIACTILYIKTLFW